MVAVEDGTGRRRGEEEEEGGGPSRGGGPSSFEKCEVNVNDHLIPLLSLNNIIVLIKNTGVAVSVM